MYHFKRLFFSKYCFLFCALFLFLFFVFLSLFFAQPCFVLCLLASIIFLSYSWGIICLIIHRRLRLVIDLLAGSKKKNQCGWIVNESFHPKTWPNSGTVSWLDAESSPCLVEVLPHCVHFQNNTHGKGRKLFIPADYEIYTTTFGLIQRWL